MEDNILFGVIVTAQIADARRGWGFDVNLVSDHNGRLVAKYSERSSNFRVKNGHCMLTTMAFDTNCGLLRSLGEKPTS